MYRFVQIFLATLSCTGVLLTTSGVIRAAEPSFNCAQVKKGSVEALVCTDEDLASLDRSLALVYAEAIGQIGEEQSAGFRAEQRGWIKGRDECWKSSDARLCARDQYVQRIAEIQARFQMVPVTGPVTYRCDDSGQSVIYVTYFATEPPTLIAECGGRTSLMYLQPSGSGTRYAGRNESLWEHQGEAMVTWGYDTPEMRCRTESASGKP